MENDSLIRPFTGKIPGKGRTSKKVSPFFRLERSERIFVFHYHVTRISCQFQVHRKKFATVILGKSGLYLSGSVYNLSFQCWLHEIAFKSWVSLSRDRQVPGVWKNIFKCSSSLWLPAIIGTFCWHTFRAFSFFRQSLHRFQSIALTRNWRSSKAFSLRNTSCIFHLSAKLFQCGSGHPEVRLQHIQRMAWYDNLTKKTPVSV